MSSQTPINLNLLIDILGTDEEEKLTEWLTLGVLLDVSDELHDGTSHEV